jgi:hypothetical protein
MLIISTAMLNDRSPRLRCASTYHHKTAEYNNYAGLCQDHGNHD